MTRRLAVSSLAIAGHASDSVGGHESDSSESRAGNGVRPVRVLQWPSVRLRPLTEAECYARCYGGRRDESVSLVVDERSRRAPPRRARRRAARTAPADRRAGDGRRGGMTRSCQSWTSRRRYAPPPEGPAEGAAPELVGLHGDVDVACATLSAAWPKPLLASPTSSPRTFAASSAGSTPGASRRRRTRISRTRETTSGGSSTTPASRRGSTSPSEQLELLGLGYGITNAAYRTTPGSGDLRRADFDRGRLERIGRRAPAACDRVRRQGGLPRRSSASARSSAPQIRTLGSTALFVLPSTSPANAAVPYPERLRWFAASHAWLEPTPREAVRAIVVDAASGCS